MVKKPTKAINVKQNQSTLFFIFNQQFPSSLILSLVGYTFLPDSEFICYF